MDAIITTRPQIEVLYDWMASGLVHYKRNCDFCDNQMALRYSYYETRMNYFWICGLCFREA